MISLKYIEVKDVLQTFFTTKLSRRLIHGDSASDESGGEHDFEVEGGVRI